MRKVRATLIALLIVMSVIPVSLGEAATIQEKHEEEEFVVDEILVKLKPGISDEVISKSKYKVKSIKNILNNFKNIEKSKLNLFKKHGLDRIFLLKLSEAADSKEVVREFNKDPNVEYAELNYIVHIALIPRDKYFSQLWNLNNTGQTGGTIDADIDAPEAWNIQTGSSNIVIAVIDSGVDYNHEDLSANIWTNPEEIPNNGLDDDSNGFIDDVRGWDFTTIDGRVEDNDPMDECGHGTHCAGIISAVGNNRNGVVGVNWNAKILPIKFIDPWGYGTIEDSVKSILYALLMNADVMSNSWGGAPASESLVAAISAANAAGVLFVAAAGNNDYNNNDVYPFYPASIDLPNIIAVAATDHNDTLIWWSSYGLQSVDLAAPGVSIYSTVPTGDCELCDPSGYTYLSGTSMATPHVAGVVALVKAEYPELTASEIKAKILNSTDAAPSLDGKVLTGGRLNAYNVFEDDSVAPAAVNNLSVIDSKFNSITLTWTATGDDGNTGKANYYDIRYSTSPVTAENWDTATKALGELKPSDPGSQETFTIVGLVRNTTYYFAMKVRDNVNNMSGLSNGCSGSTTNPAVVYSDDMESGSNGWTHSGWIGWVFPFDIWEVGVPTSGPMYAYSGSNVWATNLDGNYSVPGYPLGVEIVEDLVSPSINLSGLSSAYLVFWHNYVTESYHDGGIVEVSANGGSSWTQITPVGGYPVGALCYLNILGEVPAFGGQSPVGWTQVVFDISNYISNDFKIRFRFGTDGSSNNFPGWYIDDVTILRELSTSINTMHIDSITMSTRTVGRSTIAIATVTIVDGKDIPAPVKGATVSGHWSGLTSDLDTGVTDTDGKVVLESNSVKRAKGTFTFTVDNVSLDGWTYKSDENVITSNSITVP